MTNQIPDKSKTMKVNGEIKPTGDGARSERQEPGFMRGPWKAHFNVPTAMIPGHIVKADHGAEFPIASIWEGGGTHGKELQIANAHLIAAAPALYEALQYVSEVSERQAAKDADDSDTVNITVTVGWLREVKDALSLVDVQATGEGNNE